MDMDGTEIISATREIVWAALNDPEILKQCIPGCKELTMNDEGEMAAVVKLKIGPVSANFKGNVRFENIDAPNGYSIVGEGNGGIAGFAKGGADVRLIEENETTTILTYTAKAQIGGKMAQLGSRLVDSTSKKLAKQFFENFNNVVSGASD